VGGLTSQPAYSRVAASFARPLVVVYRGESIVVAPGRFGATARVEAAVRAALGATPRSRIGLPVTFSAAAVATFADELATRFDVAPRNAVLVGATKAGPVIRPARPGTAVDTVALRRAIAAELASGSRAPVELETRPVAAARTQRTFGSVVVIERDTNTLRLFDGVRLVRRFPVATGQAIYPTPAGTFHIVTKQRDPWWYPPTYDSWAQGLRPVPPGPGNPLGTRWMGLSTPGVGIHGTDAESSIGYSLSHGCIRMHVPDAEWLFERVRVGTPVVIL